MIRLVFEASTRGVGGVPGPPGALPLPGSPEWWQALFAARRLLQRAVVARAEETGSECRYVEGGSYVALVVSGTAAQLAPLLVALTHEPLVFGVRVHCEDERELAEVRAYAPAQDADARATFEAISTEPLPPHLRGGEDADLYEARTMHAMHDVMHALALALAGEDG